MPLRDSTGFFWLLQDPHQRLHVSNPRLGTAVSVFSAFSVFSAQLRCGYGGEGFSDLGGNFL